MRFDSPGTPVVACHMCAKSELRPVLDLGHHPPSDEFLKPQQMRHPQAHFPLRLVSCGDCGLLQIDYRVDPKILYQNDYPYESSATATGRKHYQDMARAIVERFSIAPNSLVVDIGSNVGVLLSGFRDAGLRVLGVDPAEPAAQKAIAAGIPTIIDFFNESIASNIRAGHGSAAVITGTNVFAHLHDLVAAVGAMRSLLADDGVIVIEAPSALDLVQHLEYDTIYHEHIAYLSSRPMAKFFERLGLELFDVEHQAIHGGTLRYFVGHAGKHDVHRRVHEQVVMEENSGLYEMRRLEQFADRVKQQKIKLMHLLYDLKRQGKRIAGLSAPAKGNTLLNYCRIDSVILDFVSEKIEGKIGRYTPGSHIPIVSDEELIRQKPDYALLLAWNFADEIMRNLESYRAAGGKFVIPIPEPKIVG